MNITIINGPNLNMLGQREKEHYGDFSYKKLVDTVKEHAAYKSVELDVFQSNHEGEIVSKIQTSESDCFIVNAGAYTHTSIAVRDALAAVSKPFLEVHISNVYARDRFRHSSYLSDIAEGVICGLGIYSYIAAIDYFVHKYSSV
ncbi:type II 3-dehydroquinate dehydratase [Flexistipes sp.]|uniref:type II 3-dehydroquinate dehydratase n=1 Tax=Flexistipes sp. TaxID=3088135 RepID=UPI002E1BA328|nr:type II 3-dehydroquinate dehydratase [Flexistipes sp.]